MNGSHWIVQKKIVFFSCYIIFVSLGLLAFWSSLSSLTANVFSLFAPIHYTIGIVLGVVLLFFRSISKVLFLLCYLLSLFFITSISLQILEVAWSEQTISAFVYLLALGSIIGLFTLEKNIELVKALAIPVLYSTFFFVLLFITKAISPVYRDMILILIIGQGVAYILCFILLSIFGYRQDEQKDDVRHGQLRRRKESKRVSVTLYYRLAFLVYIILLLLSWIYVSQVLDLFYLVALLLFFSFFLLAALHNSLSKSLLVHSIVAFISVPICSLSLFSSFTSTVEMMMGVYFCIGIGSYLLIMWVYTNGLGQFRLYLLSFITSITALFPLLLGEGTLPGIQEITFAFISAYSVLSILSLIVIPMMKKQWLVPRKRADRVFRQDLFTELTNKERERSDKGWKDYSAEERERNLTLQYRSWLEKKEKRLGSFFSNKND